MRYLHWLAKDDSQPSPGRMSPRSIRFREYLTGCTAETHDDDLATLLYSCNVCMTHCGMSKYCFYNSKVSHVVPFIAFAPTKASPTRRSLTTRFEVPWPAARTPCVNRCVFPSVCNSGSVSLISLRKLFLMKTWNLGSITIVPVPVQLGVS